MTTVTRRLLLSLLFTVCCIENIWSQALAPNGYEQACAASCSQGATVSQCLQSFAGVRVRANQRAFQYLSYTAREIINREVTRVIIPPINECLPGPLVTGCIQAYNLYVSRFRPPKNVAIYPSTPNKLVLAVEDLDLGLTGNLGGQINVLLPLALYGIVQANVYGASLLVEVVIDNSPRCTLCMKVVGCSVKFRYVDICIQNGGLVGDLANGLFRQTVNNMVAEKINGKVCSMVSQMVNEKINPKLGELPLSMSLAQIFSLTGSGLTASNTGQCVKAKRKCFGTPTLSHATALKQHSGVTAKLSGNTTRINSSVSVEAKAVAMNVTSLDVMKRRSELANINHLSELLKDGDTEVGETAPRAHLPLDLQEFAKIIPYDRHPNQGDEKIVRAVVGDTYKTKVADKNLQSTEKRRRLRRATIQSSASVQTVKPTVQAVDSDTAFKVPSRPILRQQQYNSSSTKLHGNSGQSHKSQRTFVVSAVTTKQTPVITHPEYRSSLVQQHGVTVMLRNLTNQKQLMSTKAPLIVNDNHPKKTTNVTRKHLMSGVTKKLVKAKIHGCPTTCANNIGNMTPGESNPCAGCPGSDSISDPITAISELFKSVDVSKLCNIIMSMNLLGTYGSCCDYSAAFSGTFSICGQPPPICPAPYNFPPNPNTNAMVEFIISEYTINSLFYQLYRSDALSTIIGPQTSKIGEFLRTTCDSSEPNRKMHESEFGDLSICLGDMLPTFSERYPNRNVAFKIYANSPPSIILAGRDAESGCANIRLDVGIDFCLATVNQCDQTNRVGSVDVIAFTTLCLTFQNGRLYGNAIVPEMNIIDSQRTLGMDANGLRKFSILGKELLSKLLNDGLEKGVEVNLPAGSLPLSLSNSQMRIIDHAVYLSSDFKLTSLPQI